MPITEAQREQRKKHIGSSDMAAILGLDRYKSAWDVWAAKTGKVVDEPEEESQAMKAGTLFEEGVLAYAEENLGPILRNQYRSLPECYLGSNVDALLRATGQPVEAKTAGLFGPLDEAWGEAGSDEVPERVIIQSHVHLLVTATDLCYVPSFLGGRGFTLYRIPRNNDIAQVIQQTAVNFWEKNVQADIPPENALPSMATIKRLRREPSKVVPLDPDKVQRWLEAAEIRKSAEKAEDEIRAEILADLGDAEAGSAGALGAITFFEQARTVFDSKGLAKAYPEIASQFISKSAYRVLRHKPKGL